MTRPHLPPSLREARLRTAASLIPGGAISSILVLLLLAVLVTPLVALAQDDDSTSPPQDTQPEAAAVAPPPISLADIPAKRIEFEAKDREIRAHLDDRNEFDSTAERLVAIEKDLGATFEKTSFESVQTAEISELMDLDTTAVSYANTLADAESKLSGIAKGLEDDLGQLHQLRQEWTDLQTTALGREAPDALVEQVAETLREIDELIGLVEDRRNEALSLLVEISESISQIANFRAEAAAYRRDKRLLSVKQSEKPIWELRLERRGDDLVRHLFNQVKSDLGHLASYTRDNSSVLILILAAALAGTLLLLLRLKRPAKALAADNPVAQRALAVISPSWPLALIVAIFALLWLAPDPAPQIFYRLLLFVLPIPSAALALRVLGTSVATSILMMAGALALFPLHPYLQLSPLLYRLVTVGQCLAVGIAVALDLAKGRHLTALHDRWRPALRWALKIAVGLLAVAVVAAVLGQIGTARALRDGVIGSLGFGLVFATLFIAIDSLFQTWLQTSFAQSLSLVKAQEQQIKRFERRLLAIVSGVAWLYSTLFSFGWKDSIPVFLEKVLGSGVRVRAVEITVGEVLAFVGIVALSFLLARIVCFVLDEEFLPRLHLQRGLPYAISTVVRYVILLAGFSLALVAAGLDLSKATLLAGAFGVGIGFGLQNVVNNFVSGLILLFERPIQVGDTVELESLMGEVTRIGIRASTVRTFQGAEVIVPNGDLISKQVVNWTLSNRRRRVEIDVGVAYGTDPEQVIRILLDAAGQHPDVSSDPEPLVIFTGFGDSSLDFQLKCWVDRFELALSVASELRVAVNRALAQAGIEIPFPQRDINLRSGDGDPAPPLVSPISDVDQDPEETRES